MSENKTIKDYAFSIIKELLFGSSGEKENPASIEGATLDDLGLDDLRREKVRLAQEERKMLARLRDVEGKKRQLFEEGARNPSERERRVLARRIKELDVRASNMDNMLQAISKQMRILNGLVQVKERSRIMAETGISKLLSDIDLQDLIIYIDKSSVDGEFQMNKLDDLLGVLEEADTQSTTYQEDKDIDEIMQAMENAQEAADSPEVLDEKFKELTRQMAEKDKSEEIELPEEDF